MLKVDVRQHGAAYCFGKKDCFCFKSQKKERKIIIKKGRKSGLLTISLRMVCPQLFGQVIGNLLQQEM